MEALLETARIGSINKAAEELGYTQSGLCYIINTFENEVGVKLLARSHSGIMLTAEGRELFPVMEAIVEKERLFDQKICQIKERKSEIIRIGTYSSLMIRWLPDVINEYARKHPDVRFEIHTGVSELNHMMLDHVIDLAFCENHILDDGYQWELISEDEMCAAVHKSLPIAQVESLRFKDIEPYYVIYPSINTKGIVAKEMKAQGVKLSKVTNVFTTDGSMTMSIVDKNRAVSFVSRLYQPECPKNVKLISMKPRLYRKIGVAVHEGSAQSKTIQQFLNFVKKRPILSE